MADSLRDVGVRPSPETQIVSIPKYSRGQTQAGQP